MYSVRVKGSTEDIECLSKKIKFTKNQAEILTFQLDIGNFYFNKFRKYLDYIQVIDLRDNSLVFDGRVIGNQVEMDSTGDFINTVTCESALNYFNDTHVEVWEFHPLDLPPNAPFDAIPNATVETFLKKLLDNHNSRVSTDKQIQLGNIEITDPVYIKTNFETSLNALVTKILDRHDGYLIIRNENGINYLDFLATSPIKTIQTVEVGVNMQSLEVDDSNTNIFTRIIPFGANGIGIATVNNGLNYVQDDDLVKKYGVIEQVMKWEDVTIAENLLKKAKATFSQVKTEADQIKLTALDLSYINNNFNALKLYTPIHAINKLLSYDQIHEIVAVDLDLYNPFASTFDLDTEQISATDNVSSAVEQINSNKIEIVSIGSALETKVSDGEFESFKIQTANEIQDKVSEGDVKTIVTQNASSWGLSIDGNLQSTNYTFNQNGFTIKGKNGNCLITDTEATWTDNQGNSFSVGANGFNMSSNGVTGAIKYMNYIVRRPNIKNGSVENIQLPNNFRGKQLDQDFSVNLICAGVNSDTDARFRKDAVRNMFINITNWDSNNAVLSVMPCIQKIGLDTHTMWGWNNATTTSGNTIGEGSMNIVVIISM